MKIRNNLLLCIIPFFIIVLDLFMLKDGSAFFMSWVDPTYAYLFNGLNLAQCETGVGHIDHPGTPVQCLAAIVIRIVYFFRNDKSIIESVMLNSELYISAIVYTLISLNSLMLYFIGYFVNKFSRNILSGLFFQLTPVVSLSSIYFGIVPASESLLMFGSVGLMLVLFLYTFSADKFRKIYLLIIIALFSGFLLSVKIPSFTLLFIPLILLRNIKERILFIVFTAGFFLLFVSPVLSRFANHIHFIFRLITHTGKYGGGNEGIIDTGLFFSNLKSLFLKEFIFTGFYILLFFSVVFILLKNKSIPDDSKTAIKFIYGIFVTLTLHILIVAKHYSFHYLIPVYSVVIPGIYAIYRIFKPKVSLLFRKINISFNLQTGLLFIVFILLYIRLIDNYGFFPDIEHPGNATVDFLEDYKDSPRITLLDGCIRSAYRDYALYFGTVYSGDMKVTYSRILHKHYPDSYFYSMDKGLFDWNNESVLKTHIFSRHNQLILYSRGDSVSAIKAINKLLPYFIDNKLFKLDFLYSNQKTEERIYRLVCDTDLIKKAITPENHVFCNLEIISNDEYSDTTGNYFFDKAELNSTKYSFSGNNSIRLTPELAYGLDTKLKIHSNIPFFIIRAWRHSVNEKGLIATNTNGFGKGGAKIIKSGKDGWQQIELAVNLPKNIKDSCLSIFFWNNGKDEVFFDDITIQEYSFKFSD